MIGDWTPETNQSAPFREGVTGTVPGIRVTSLGVTNALRASMPWTVALALRTTFVSSPLGQVSDGMGVCCFEGELFALWFKGEVMENH